MSLCSLSCAHANMHRHSDTLCNVKNDTRHLQNICSAGRRSSVFSSKNSHFTTSKSCRFLAFPSHLFISSTELQFSTSLIFCEQHSVLPFISVFCVLCGGNMSESSSYVNWCSDTKSAAEIAAEGILLGFPVFHVSPQSSCNYSLSREVIMGLKTTMIPLFTTASMFLITAPTCFDMLSTLK